MYKPPYRIKNMMPGMIMLWHGSKETVPSGWHICDGSMGTPDLLRYFVRCASDIEPPLSSGGEFNHKHEFIGDGHSHDLVSGPQILDSDPAGDFYHATGTSPSTGTTKVASHLPPWKTLYYIMKL